MHTWPFVVDPAELQQRLAEPGLLIVDLGSPERYAAGHIPGAVHLDYVRIVAKREPTVGLLPDLATLTEVLSELGLTTNTQVVAYDEEGGGKAARLLWTLDVLGHDKISLLDGGIVAWEAVGLPLVQTASLSRRSDYVAAAFVRATADADYIKSRLGQADFCVLDARSPLEFSAQKQTDARSGHMPGAVNIEWTSLMDREHALRLLPADVIRTRLQQNGITPDKEVLVHCRSHHRSAHTYMVLKSLGYANVKGYPGSWSDWGNRADTPVEA